MYNHHPNYPNYEYSSQGNQANRKNNPYTMTVEGKGNVTARPDQAKIIIGVVTENPTVQQAQQENTVISNRVINALKQLGIEDGDIRTTIYSIYPRYDYVEGKSILKGYGVEHQFEVTVKDLSKVGIIYDVAIKNGVNRSGPIQFRISNPDYYYREALKVALQNASEKAETIAQTIGARLIEVPIKIIEQGSPPEKIAPFSLYQVAAATTKEAPPIQEGEFTVNAIVHVVYRYARQ